MMRRRTKRGKEDGDKDDDCSHNGGGDCERCGEAIHSEVVFDTLR